MLLDYKEISKRKNDLDNYLSSNKKMAEHFGNVTSVDNGDYLIVSREIEQIDYLPEELIYYYQAAFLRDLTKSYTQFEKSLQAVAGDEFLSKLLSPSPTLFGINVKLLDDGSVINADETLKRSAIINNYATSMAEALEQIKNSVDVDALFKEDSQIGASRFKEDALSRQKYLLKVLNDGLTALHNLKNTSLEYRELRDFSSMASYQTRSFISSIEKILERQISEDAKEKLLKYAEKIKEFQRFLAQQGVISIAANSTSWLSRNLKAEKVEKNKFGICDITLGGEKFLVKADDFAFVNNKGSSTTYYDNNKLTDSLKFDFVKKAIESMTGQELEKYFEIVQASKSVAYGFVSGEENISLGSKYTRSNPLFSNFRSFLRLKNEISDIQQTIFSIAQKNYEMRQPIEAITQKIRTELTREEYSGDRINSILNFDVKSLATQEESYSNFLQNANKSLEASLQENLEIHPQMMSPVGAMIEAKKIASKISQYEIKISDEILSSEDRDDLLARIKSFKRLRAGIQDIKVDSCTVDLRSGEAVLNETAQKLLVSSPKFAQLLDLLKKNAYHDYYEFDRDSLKENTNNEINIDYLITFFDRIQHLRIPAPFKSVFKTRMLGNIQASGVFYLFSKIIALDFRASSSYIHELTHLIDLTHGVNFPERKRMAESLNYFFDSENKIGKDHAKRNYFLKYEELIARAGEIAYMLQLGNYGAHYEKFKAKQIGLEEMIANVKDDFTSHPNSFFVKSWDGYNQSTVYMSLEKDFLANETLFNFVNDYFKGYYTNEKINTKEYKTSIKYGAEDRDKEGINGTTIIPLEKGKERQPFVEVTANECAKNHFSPLVIEYNQVKEMSKDEIEKLTGSIDFNTISLSEIKDRIDAYIFTADDLFEKHFKEIIKAERGDIFSLIIDKNLSNISWKNIAEYFADKMTEMIKAGEKEKVENFATSALYTLAKHHILQKDAGLFLGVPFYSDKSAGYQERVAAKGYIGLLEILLTAGKPKDDNPIGETVFEMLDRHEALIIGTEDKTIGYGYIQRLENHCVFAEKSDRLPSEDEMLAFTKEIEFMRKYNLAEQVLKDQPLNEDSIDSISSHRLLISMLAFVYQHNKIFSGKENVNNHPPLLAELFKSIKNHIYDVIVDKNCTTIPYPRNLSFNMRHAVYDMLRDNEFFKNIGISRSDAQLAMFFTGWAGVSSFEIDKTLLLSVSKEELKTILDFSSQSNSIAIKLAHILPYICLNDSEQVDKFKILGLAIKNNPKIFNEVFFNEIRRANTIIYNNEAQTVNYIPSSFVMKLEELSKMTLAANDALDNSDTMRKTETKKRENYFDSLVITGKVPLVLSPLSIDATKHPLEDMFTYLLKAKGITSTLVYLPTLFKNYNAKKIVDFITSETLLSFKKQYEMKNGSYYEMVFTALAYSSHEKMLSFIKNADMETLKLLESSIDDKTLYTATNEFTFVTRPISKFSKELISFEKAKNAFYEVNRSDSSTFAQRLSFFFDVGKQFAESKDILLDALKNITKAANVNEICKLEDYANTKYLLKALFTTDECHDLGGTSSAKKIRELFSENFIEKIKASFYVNKDFHLIVSGVLSGDITIIDNDKASLINQIDSGLAFMDGVIGSFNFNMDDILYETKEHIATLSIGKLNLESQKEDSNLFEAKQTLPIPYMISRIETFKKDLHPNSFEELEHCCKICKASLSDLSRKTPVINQTIINAEAFCRDYFSLNRDVNQNFNNKDIPEYIQTKVNNLKEKAEVGLDNFAKMLTVIEQSSAAEYPICDAVKSLFNKLSSTPENAKTVIEYTLKQYPSIMNTVGNKDYFCRKFEKTESLVVPVFFLAKQISDGKNNLTQHYVKNSSGK